MLWHRKNKILRTLVVACLAMAGFFVLTAPPASATVTTVNTSADAFTASDLPTTVNNGTYVSMDASPLRYGYFKFAVTVPAGETVTSAIFKCWPGSSNSAGAGLWTTSSSWSETTLTWNNAPVPNFGLPASGQTGAVTSGSYSAVADVTSAITGSGTYTLVAKTTSSTQWSCTSKENTGNHPAQLVVTSQPAANQPPVASFTNPPSCTNLMCNFDGSGSSDPDGTIASYDWNFGDGSTHGTGATPSHTYAANGTYTVTLTVTDNGGATNAVSHNVTVAANVAPTASFTSSCTNLACTFNGSGSSDPDGSISSYDWNWGDGTTHGTGVTPSHTYAAAGTYPVTLTVTDNQGATGAVSNNVTVTAANVPPTAAFTSSCTFLVCNFNGSTSSDPDGTISSYSWNFGDGSALGTGATPSHTYAAAGTYTVTLTVTDNQGATGSVPHDVTVAAAPTHTNTTLPARGTFSYPWFPEAWNQGGFNPATHYNPSLGFYNSVDVMAQHVQEMLYGNFVFDVSSWWGQGSKEDVRLQPLLNAAHGTALKVAPYYEAEGNAITGVTGSPNPTSAQITSDLNYIAANYVNDPNYMWVNDKPVIFAFGDSSDGCGMVDRWVAANAAATTHFYVVLKVFGGYAACTNQPDKWHQYGPAAAADAQGANSYTISPGFWLFSEASPRLARDTARWTTNVNDMNCSTASLKLVTTFNEWGEGSSVESATQWSSASGHGTYLDTLHNSTTCGPVDNPPVAALTVTPSSGQAPLAVNADASASTDTDATPISTYNFAWGDGSSTGAQAGATASHTYTAACSCTVTVTVTDTAGKVGTTTKPVTVTGDAAPVAALTVTPSSGNAPLAVTANASASTDTDATPISTYTFAWGDGSANTGPQSGSSAPHTYTTAGNFTVTVTVTDTAGLSGTTTKPVTVTTAGGGGQHKVIMIMEENHSLAQADAQMPYLTGLGNTYGKATGYHAVIHPSLGNYIAWADGDSFGITDDNPPSSHPIAGDSVFDQTIAAGKTAKNYAEGMTSNCMLTNTGRYVIKHNPWGYNNGTTQRANCNANNVPMGSTTSGNLLNDINAGNLPVSGYMEPDLCNDAHDCSLATADTWLQGWIPKLMNGPDYTSGNLTIIVTFDEDDGSQGNLVAFKVIDPNLLNVHKVVSTSTNHYALTRWFDDNAGVPRLRNAATAFDLRGAFGFPF